MDNTTDQTSCKFAHVGVQKNVLQRETAAPVAEVCPIRDHWSSATTDIHRQTRISHHSIAAHMSHDHHDMFSWRLPLHPSTLPTAPGVGLTSLGCVYDGMATMGRAYSICAEDSE